MSLYASFNGTLTTTIDEVESILTHTSWRYRGPHEIKAVGKSALLRGVTDSQQSKTVSSIRALAKAAQDLAQAANQSTQLINDAIGGHVLIRREPGGTNEILIMDHEDPAQATKIWRWNLGGLGYSDNVTGADNPDRDYDVAMTMDGAINADFVKTGKLIADVVQIGAGTTFATGYDPSEKETPDGAQSKANAAANAAQAAAEAHADAKAEAEAAAAQAAAEETAQGYVSAETQARIAEAAANLAAAKSHADSAASSAESTAKTYASTLLQSLADGTYTGGTFLDGTRIVAPEIHAGKVFGLSGTFYDMLIGNPEGSRLQIAPTEPREPYELLTGEPIASGYGFPGQPDSTYAPEHAFDGDISTMWMHDIAGAFWWTWIGLDFTGHNVAYCVKQMRIYQATSYDLELQYYDEDEHEWVTTDSDIDGTGDDWVELDVNGNDVFAYKWRLQFPISTVGGLKELELYGVPYNPLMAGFNKDNEKIYELSDDGLRIFNDRLFMNNNQAAVIIDQGSNDNGSYVRWSNGLLICWNTVTLTYEHSGLLNTVWYYPYGFPFSPAPAFAGFVAPAKYAPIVGARGKTDHIIKCDPSFAEIGASGQAGIFSTGDKWDHHVVIIGWWWK